MNLQYGPPALPSLKLQHLTQIVLHVSHGQVGHQLQALLQLDLQQPGQQVEAHQVRRVHNRPVN